jgi:hypothetical protein
LFCVIEGASAALESIGFIAAIRAIFRGLSLTKFHLQLDVEFEMN